MFEEEDVVSTIIGILFIVIPSMLLGRLFSFWAFRDYRFSYRGVLLGPFAISGLVPFFENPIFQLDDLTLILWQISGIIILFSVGLYFTFKDLRNAGYRAGVVGILGVITPVSLKNSYKSESSRML